MRARRHFPNKPKALSKTLEIALDSEETAKRRLAKAGYKKAFKQAFPDSRPSLTFDNIVLALAVFQRTLVTDDRFNHFLAGDDNALNLQEKRGLILTLNKGCSTCHDGSLIGGQQVMKMELVKPHPNTIDKGMGAITLKTKKPADLAGFLNRNDVYIV